MNKQHTTTQAALSDWETQWQTAMGGWYPGEGVTLRGKDLLNELGSQGWMSVLMYAITGREFSPTQIQLFEGIWSISTSFPDPRLWNNRIAALAGTARSTPALGLSSALAVSEATIYGQRPLLAAMAFLQRTLQRYQQGQNLESLLQQALQAKRRGRPGSGKCREVARLPGFGRPIVSRDERIEPLMNLARRLDCDRGEHVCLALEIESTLALMGEDWCMNIAALMGALCADQGLTPRQYYHYTGLCFSAGIIACGLDAEQHPPGAFFPLRCDRLRYQGPEPRRWPHPIAKPNH